MNKLNPRYLTRSWQNRLYRKADGSKGLERPAHTIDLPAGEASTDALTVADVKSRQGAENTSQAVPESDLVIPNLEPEKAAISNYRPPTGLKAWWLRKRRAALDFYHFLRPVPTEEEIQEKKDQKLIKQIRDDGVIFARKLSNYFGSLRFEYVEREDGKATRHRVPFKVLLYDWDPDQHTGGNIIKLYFGLGSRGWPYGIMPTDLISQPVLDASLPALHHYLSGFSDRAGAGVIIQRAGFQGLPDLVPIREMWQIMGENRPPLTWCFGPSHNGQVIWRNLVDFPHLLIAGQTDAGKSNAVHVGICTMIKHNTPAHLQLLLIDMKEGVEFEDYSGIPHLFQGLPIFSDPKQVIDQVLPLLAAEEQHRLNKIKNAGYKNVKQYNMHHLKEKRIPLLVVIIDEIATLTECYSGGFIGPLTERARKCRAAGIHFVITTQYPKADVLPTLITMNFPARLAFHMTSTSSNVVIEDGRASELVGQGRAVLYHQSEYLTVQLPLISDDEIRATVHEAITGKHIKAESYNLDEIMQYALEHYGGQLHQDALYQVFKKQISQNKLRKLLNSLADSGQVINISGTPYKAVRGTGGTNPRRLVRLDTLPTTEPAG